ncbi:WASH complex subunit 3 [Toxorhynchites rutilus septentrionalis]|uniref:WASH complex subunit 3 n=1 Tax=Toxorhynchites rutilus septentrionalis TaxID=329112 RepID=UPI00247B0436|nr:WASH complex subunit 3 [Toxorhynchites rutilus septentrionalis]
METIGLEKHELPPTNQKRMVAFINHFVLSTVNFLNKFAADCEDKFIEYEYKMQSLEASLLIIEAKLASIEALKNGTVIASGVQDEKTETPAEVHVAAETDDDRSKDTAEVPIKERDQRYDKYFKMVQVGVPILAVKNKISSEGLDPEYIDEFL